LLVADPAGPTPLAQGFMSLGGSAMQYVDLVTQIKDKQCNVETKVDVHEMLWNRVEEHSKATLGRLLSSRGITDPGEDFGVELCGLLAFLAQEVMDLRRQVDSAQTRGGRSTGQDYSQAARASPERVPWGQKSPSPQYQSPVQVAGSAFAPAAAAQQRPSDTSGRFLIGQSAPAAATRRDPVDEPRRAPRVEGVDRAGSPGVGQIRQPAGYSESGSGGPRRAIEVAKPPSRAAQPVAASGPAVASEDLQRALFVSQGSWAREYRNARNNIDTPNWRRDAFELLCKTGIVTFQEIRSDSQVSTEHIEECAGIAREMLRQQDLDYWLTNVESANLSFQQRLEALFTNKGMPTEPPKEEETTSSSWW